MCDSVECLLDKARFTNPCASQHSQDVRALVSADAAEGVDEQTDFSFPADEWCLNSRAPVKAENARSISLSRSVPSASS